MKTAAKAYESITRPELSGDSGITPPWSDQVEALLLSALLIDDTAGSWAISTQIGLRSTSFFKREHQAIWEAIDELRKAGKPADLTQVAETLRLKGTLDELGGYAMLIEVTKLVPTTAHVRIHAEQVALLWQMRNALKLSAAIGKAVYDSGNAAAFRSAIAGIAERMIHYGRPPELRSLEERCLEVEEVAREQAEGRENRGGWISTGLANFDRDLRPFGIGREDAYVILAGGSGHGKSAGARQIALHALLGGQRVAVISKETTVQGFLMQMAANRVGVDLNNLATTPRDMVARLLDFMKLVREEWADKRLWCAEPNPSQPLETVEDLADWARAHVHLHGAPDLWVVDYLQLFGTRKRTSNREQEVATVSHALQGLCRTLGGVWIVTCQFNEAGLREQRAVKRTEDGKVMHRIPVPGDLRESQAAYHDADRVIALYQPAVDCNDNEQNNPNCQMPEIWWCQIKRRWGRCGVAKMWFQKRFTRFAPLGESDAAKSDSNTASESGAMHIAAPTSKNEWLKKQSDMRSKISP